eukprot:CAMPEP_0197628648 /NCGR_PEP_ID=MMETSP1338-20131121/6864_1 /TAXON_ID=43686 ORGANISM="Pelagodinium beii, Strain RCC1491" /NCGR_SAMPLE_ID=MMETSP1338 /ASSEMBLY_ACC=CAM_ASM_000754 /LENGTH=226 /DNA_ID=CAMNT_0043199637 /DNA_START=38 /DNA_END=718 /DNA_ORIENTATION=+
MAGEVHQAPQTEQDLANSEDAGLAQLALPAALMRRIAKSAVPGLRLSSEAFAGLHRVAQAYICFATEKSLAEVRAEGNKAKKGSKAAPAARKTLNAEHVMRFLTSEIPPMATKLSNMCPELMPEDFKPAAVKLLEQLRDQQKVPHEPTSLLEAGQPQQSPVKTADTAEAGLGAFFGRQKRASEVPAGGTKSKKLKGGETPAPRSLKSLFAAKPPPQEEKGIDEPQT